MRRSNEGEEENQNQEQIRKARRIAKRGRKRNQEEGTGKTREDKGRQGKVEEQAKQQAPNS